MTKCIDFTFQSNYNKLVHHFKLFQLLFQKFFQNLYLTMLPFIMFHSTHKYSQLLSILALLFPFSLLKKLWFSLSTLLISILAPIDFV